MAGTKEIKRRIKSVKNIKKITKAMELVAVAKMKRAVSNTLASRLYAEYSWNILTSIGANIEKMKHPLFEEREVKKILLVLITSNRGLCGAYNAQIGRKTIAFLKDSVSKYKDAEIDIVTIGKKGEVMMRRIGKNILASFSELPDNISLRDIIPLSSMLVDEYKLEKYDKVIVSYTDFVSALSQKPKIRQLLPISRGELRELIDELGSERDKKVEKERDTEYLFEGDKEKLVGELSEKLVRMQIYQMLLESRASEQSSRMIAMKNASDSAGEMIEDFTLLFNKARQAGITREISEISAGMASVN
ncbi:MAG: ATP synthase F1 subunit gamma [Candidatus Paceibacterota bacterium]|jgi:F-type H+-transporting ATPase subunit gamma